MNTLDPNQRQVVIVAYKPKPGMEDELLQLTREHVPLLRERGLATDMPVTAMRAQDGTIVEVFEWAEGALPKAHTDPELARLWERYYAACDFLPLNQLPEATQMFAGFTRIEL